MFGTQLEPTNSIVEELVQVPIEPITRASSANRWKPWSDHLPSRTLVEEHK
jgi:hypothetical protein